MRIDQLIEEFEYTIIGGDVYRWKCYGPNARFLDMGKAEGWGIYSF